MRTHTKSVAEKGMKTNFPGLGGWIYPKMPWLKIHGCVKIKASVMNPSVGFIYWAELVLLAGLQEQLDPCMQSWPVPAIC